MFIKQCCLSYGVWLVCGFAFWSVGVRGHSHPSNKDDFENVLGDFALTLLPGNICRLVWSRWSFPLMSQSCRASEMNTGLMFSNDHCARTCAKYFTCVGWLSIQNTKLLDSLIFLIFFIDKESDSWRN